MPTDDPAALRDALDASQAQLEALQAELDETNRGVLALYAELDTQAQQLRQATELKSRFLAYMSHEFRTPISSIRSLTRLLLDRVDGPLTDEQEKQVNFIRTTSEEFADMVNDLLDLAKVEAGRIDVSPAWFELVDLFAALRGMFKPVLVNPEVQLIFEEPQGIAQLFTDDAKLSQILRNYISNALKFTAQGEVRVSAVTAPGPSGVAGEDEITFSVADTGIGIAAEFHDAIFQDFTQIGSPIQKRLRGTGLGLSLSKRLAELLGGRVGLRSEPGVGSVFSVTLPLRLPGAADAADAAIAADAAAPGATTGATTGVATGVATEVPDA
ncbi:histidine kinase [Roseateles noduli]|nr:histidine kinase [Roseateles noduli]